MNMYKKRSELTPEEEKKRLERLHRSSQYRRERKASDPAYAEHIRKVEKERRRELMKDPAYAAKVREYNLIKHAKMRDEKIRKTREGLL